MIVDEDSRKIIGSYKTKEEAQKNNHGKFGHIIWFDETDLQYKLYKNENNEWCISKSIIEGGFNYLDLPNRKKRKF